MRPTPSTLGLHLLALAGLCVGTASGMSFNGYEVTGRRRMGDFAFGNVEGTVRFAVEGTDFEATLVDAPTLGGPPSAFSGTYAELDLFLISFWSYDGIADSFRASGSGIRLFFGLLVLGSLRANDYTIEFSGVFAGQARTERAPVRGLHSRSVVRLERYAEARRRRRIVRSVDPTRGSCRSTQEARSPSSLPSPARDGTPAR